MTLQLHDLNLRGFASDNYAGVHPEILDAIAAANNGHQISYGEDVYTERLHEVFAEHFGEGVQVFPVFNGTGANVVGLQSMVPRWGAVVCAKTAHINTDEAGAPEKVGGLKLLPVETPDGKLTPELIDREAWGWGDEHRAQPLVVSITQTTEVGTAYTVEEIRAIADHVHARGMKLHMDGARISNAAATLGVPPACVHHRRRRRRAELRRDQERHAVRRGRRCAQPGLLRGAALPAQAEHAARLEDAVHLRAAHRAAHRRPLRAFGLARQRHGLRLRGALEAGIADGSIRGVGFSQATEANGVFATLPAGVADRLREHFRFYDWDASRNEVRWMCSYDTTEQDIDDFVAALVGELSA